MKSGTTPEKIVNDQNIDKNKETHPVLKGDPNKYDDSLRGRANTAHFESQYNLHHHHHGHGEIIDHPRLTGNSGVGTSNTQSQNFNSSSSSICSANSHRKTIKSCDFSSESPTRIISPYGDNCRSLRTRAEMLASGSTELAKNPSDNENANTFSSSVARSAYQKGGGKNSPSTPKSSPVPMVSRAASFSKVQATERKPNTGTLSTLDSNSTEDFTVISDLNDSKSSDSESSKTTLTNTVSNNNLNLSDSFSSDNGDQSEVDKETRRNSQRNVIPNLRTFASSLAFSTSASQNANIAPKPGSEPVISASLPKNTESYLSKVYNKASVINTKPNVNRTSCARSRSFSNYDSPSLSEMEIINTLHEEEISTALENNNSESNTVPQAENSLDTTPVNDIQMTPTPDMKISKATVEKKEERKTEPRIKATETDETNRTEKFEEKRRMNDKVMNAALTGDVEFMKDLVLAGVTFDFADSEGRTPLHAAASEGRLHAVEFLVLQEVNLNAIDANGYTPLEEAMLNGFQEVADLLVSAGGTAKQDLGARLCAYTSQGKLEKVKALVEAGVSVNSWIESDLRTPLHFAAFYGFTDIAKFLIKKGADVSPIDRFGKTPLQVALSEDHKELVALLEKHSAVIAEPSDAFELCKAAGTNEFYKLQALVELKGVDVDSVDYDGRTAIHLAASEGHIEVVSYLVEMGANIEVTDRWGFNPYQDALRNGHFEVADFLIKHNADVVMNNELSIDDPDVKNGLEQYEDYGECCRRFGRNRDVVHTAFNTLLNRLGPKFNWDYCEFWTINPHYLVLELCHDCWYINPNAPTYKKLHRFKDVSKGVLIEYNIFFGGSVLTKRKPAWFTHLASLPQLNFFRSPMCRMAGLSTCVAVPVAVDDELFGAIVFFSCEDRTPVEIPVDYTISTVGSIVSAVSRLERDLISRFSYGNLLRECIANDLDSTITSVITETRGLKPIVLWACSPNSEDHKAALPVLNALSDVAPSLLVRPEWEYIIKCLTDCLYFLDAVSLDVKPPKSTEPSVKQHVMENLIKLQRCVTLRAKPYFSFVHSPLMIELMSLKNVLAEEFRNLVETKYPNIEDWAVKKKGMVLISSSDTFRVFGNRQGVKPGKVDMYGRRPKNPSANESDKAAKLCNNLILKGTLLSVESLKELHKCLTLDEGCKSGNYRSETVVGSFQFYKFYRVFVPMEEIAKAMAFLFESIHSGDNHPVLMAFYMYKAIVHYIHPFSDGNGRMSRLIGNLILKTNGYVGTFMDTDKVLLLADFLERLERLSKAVRR